LNDPAEMAAAREEMPSFGALMDELDADPDADPTNSTDESGYPIAQTCLVLTPKITTKVLAWADSKTCDISEVPYIRGTLYCSSLLTQCVDITI
jgi:hypothetical protein